MTLSNQSILDRMSMKHTKVPLMHKFIKVPVTAFFHNDVMISNHGCLMDPILNALDEEEATMREAHRCAKD